MRRFDKDDRQDSGSFIESLYTSKVTSSLEKSDDLFAEIKSFQSTFRQIQRTTDMIRRMLQVEFKFDGMVNGNATGLTTAAENDLLKADWFASTFVIANYSNVEPWLAKALTEHERGRVVVVMVPSRTNTGWFHEKILDRAKEVRFIKGRVVFESNQKPSAFSDALAIFDGIPKPSRRKSQQQVGLICCSKFNESVPDVTTTSHIP
jgi:hypothetical protein